MSHPVLKVNRMRTMYVPGLKTHVHSYRRFDPGGSLDRLVNLSLRVADQMGWREMEHKGGKRGSCYPLRQGDALVVGVTSVRERERESEPVRQLVSRATLPHGGPGPSFYRCKERVQVYNGGCS
jgi:hypothetical protein